MTIFEYLKIPDIILSLFLHNKWTGLKLLAPTVLCGKSDQGAHGGIRVLLLPNPNPVFNFI